ncbi:MAG: hypothetical protein HZB51_19170 [Chloroflexi bacterium]|nr:hypothetical protein [Chloroflexota bacterium]
MNAKILFALTLLLVAVLVVGCGSSPTVTPAATATSQVVTVVITATPPPPTATSAQPTLTPIPTVGLTLTPTVATLAAPTKAAVATRPPATRTPTKVATPPTATALPIKYGAPTINKPIWSDSEKDEVKFDGSAIVFDWQSLGGLQGDECYLLQVRTEAVNGGVAPRSDYWLVKCGDQTPIGFSIKFTLESPKRGSPNYDSIKTGSDQMWAHWSVTVVKNLGQCDASKLKCKYAPLSPTSTNYFLFKGQ